MENNSPNYYIALFIAGSPLGWFGLHHYYVGNKKRAVVYFLFFWTLVPSLLSLIDATILLRRGEEKFIEKHGTDEEINEYYLRKLQENNAQIPVNDSINTENEKKETADDSEEDAENKDVEKFQEPDYSDYYGDW